MKRLHVHLSVPDLQQGIHFYSQMFGQQPTRIKSDYAKWQLDDPQVNFAISTRSANIGLDHLGLQVSDEEELKVLNERLLQADSNTGALDSTTCCYAESIKSWSVDPAGIPWESFTTMHEVDIFGIDQHSDSTACCAGAAPARPDPSSCC